MLCRDEDDECWEKRVFDRWSFSWGAIWQHVYVFLLSSFVVSTNRCSCFMFPFVPSSTRSHQPPSVRHLFGETRQLFRRQWLLQGNHEQCDQTGRKYSSFVAGLLQCSRETSGRRCRNCSISVLVCSHLKISTSKSSFQINLPGHVSNTAACVAGLSCSTSVTAAATAVSSTTTTISAAAVAAAILWAVACNVSSFAALTL